MGDDPVPPPEPDTRTALPGRAGWTALAGFLLAQALSLAGSWLGLRLAPEQLVLRLLLAQAGLWAQLVGGGSAKVRKDLSHLGSYGTHVVPVGILLATAH